MTAHDATVIEAAFLAACQAELTALKPGNVHVHAGGHGMQVTHFMAAASAAAPIVADPSLQPGARISAAVAASMEAAGCNTNLGILLLAVPIAAAAERRAHGGSLHNAVRAVLEGLDMQDAHDVFAAITRANPGGLGRSEEADVTRPPTMPLREAMALAAPRDRIAANYISGFNDIFSDHLPALAEIRRGSPAGPPPRPDDAVATLYMSLLARFADSHVRRKYGPETAAHVQALARAAKPLWSPVVRPAAHPGLLQLDALLKAHEWNPGTTADFVVATLFAADLEQRRSY